MDTFVTTTPRITVRTPVPPDAENGRRALEICPAATVNGVALPMVAPVALTKLIVPVQDAAVPFVELDATFTTLISAVSVLPRPAGGKVKLRVLVVAVVCAAAENIPATAIKVKTKLLMLNSPRMIFVH